MRFLHFLILLFIFSSSSPNLFGQNPDANKRAGDIIRKRKVGLSSQEVSNILENETEPSVVWMSTSLFIGQENSTPAQIAGLLTAAANRQDCFYQIAAQVALSDKMKPCVDSLVSQKAAEAKFAGATVMAIRSQIKLGKKKGKKGKAKGKGKGKALSASVDFTDNIRSLLENKNRELVELAILTAAYSGASLDDEIDAIDAKKSAEILAAQVLYNAHRGRPISDLVARLSKMRVKSDKEYQTLSARLSSFDPTSHPFCYAAQAIGVAKEKTELDFLHELLVNRDIRVQSDAAQALELIGDENSIDSLIQALPKATWPAKIRIYSALGAIPAKRTMPVLIQEMKNEPGRLRLDISYALASIIGNDIGANADGWEAAWSEMEGTFEIDSAATKKFRKANKVKDMRVRSLGTFYDLGIYSSQFVYVVDTSASMKGEKIKNLEENLSSSTGDLKEPGRFNIVMFGGDIVLASDRLLTATSGTYVADQIYGLKLSVATRTFDAIYIGGQFDEVDTIYYLSDGAPVLGSFQSWNTIIPAYGFLHRYRPIAMYTVPFQAGTRNERAMELFANENYGRCAGLNE